MDKLGRLLFAGLPILRRRPLVVLAWGVGLLPLSIFGTLASGVYDGVKGPWSWVAAGAAHGWLLFGLGFLCVFSICASMAVLSAAVFRAVMDPERTDGRWMRLGGDEARLTLVWGLLFLAVCAMSIVVMTVGLFSRRAQVTLNVDPLLVGGVLSIVFLARFSLVPTAAVFDRRIDLAASWSWTEGRYRVALGCALMFLLFYGGNEMLLSMLGKALRHGAATAKIGYDSALSELARYALKPEHLVPDLVRVLTGSVAGVLAYAPMAALYRDLTGRNSADQAAVFD